MTDGHPFKFLAIVDGSPESELATYFAALRAAHTQGRVYLLTIVEPGDFHHWLGVGEEMSREARAKAQAEQERMSAIVRAETGADPECAIVEGAVGVELRKLIEKDPGIRILVLGAKAGRNPGPLVQALSRGGKDLFGSRAIPVAVLPSTLSRDDIKVIA